MTQCDAKYSRIIIGKNTMRLRHRQENLGIIKFLHLQLIFGSFSKKKMISVKIKEEANLLPKKCFLMLSGNIFFSHLQLTYDRFNKLSPLSWNIFFSFLTILTKILHFFYVFQYGLGREFVRWLTKFCCHSQRITSSSENRCHQWMCDIYVQPVCKKFTGMNFHLSKARGIFVFITAIEKSILCFFLHERVIKS